MITTHTDAYKEVEKLIRTSLIHWNSIQVNAWLNNQYDPKHMFGLWQENHLIGLIQTMPTKIQLKDNTVSALGITLACIHPDYRQHGHFKQLLRAVLEKSHYNHVLTYVHTQCPKLFEGYRFETMATSKQAWIEQGEKGTATNVSTQFTNTYDIYTQFMCHFEGTPIWSEQQYLSFLRYQIQLGKTILSTQSGVAVYDQKMNSIDTLWYLNSAAIDDFLAFTNDARIHFSSSEHLDKFYTMHLPRKTNTLLVRLNDPRLYARANHQTLQSIQTIYSQLNHPVWSL